MRTPKAPWRSARSVCRSRGGRPKGSVTRRPEPRRVRRHTGKRPSRCARATTPTRMRVRHAVAVARPALGPGQRAAQDRRLTRSTTRRDSHGRRGDGPAHCGCGRAGPREPPVTVSPVCRQRPPGPRSRCARKRRTTGRLTPAERGRSECLQPPPEMERAEALPPPGHPWMWEHVGWGPSGWERSDPTPGPAEGLGGLVLGGTV